MNFSAQYVRILHMKELDAQRQMDDSIADDLLKDRTRFAYASDIISSVTLEPDLIISEAGVEGGYGPIRTMWTESNETVRRIIAGEVNYGSLPFDDENEIYKGMLYKDQGEFVQQYPREQKLCEATNSNCKEVNCPLFVAPEKNKLWQPICSEFKIMFIKH